MSAAEGPSTAGPVTLGSQRSGPRAAVQIDPGEREDFQRAARLVLAHPLVTETWPRPGALALVRRWEVPLANELSRVLGYRLDLGRSCARLYRRSAVTSPHRGPFTRTRRPLGRWACSFLCLVLAALERLGDQTTASALAEEVMRLRAGDEALPVDLTRYDQRRAFVDAVKWLEDRGVLGLCDGAVEGWLADEATGDALYDIDRDVVSRLLVASPSVLRDVSEAADFLVETPAPGDDARRTQLRHRVARRLVGEPLVAYGDLDDDELAYVRHRRTRLAADIEMLTGCSVEARAEGLCLVDAPVEAISAQEFPAGGTVVQAALLWGAAMVESATTGEARPVSDGPAVPAPTGRVDPVTAEAAWAQVVATYRDRFKAEYRDAPDRLHRDVIALLERFGLVTACADGAVEVSAALARYRPGPGDAQPRPGTGHGEAGRAGGDGGAPRLALVADDGSGEAGGGDDGDR